MRCVYHDCTYEQAEAIAAAIARDTGRSVNRLYNPEEVVMTDDLGSVLIYTEDSRYSTYDEWVYVGDRYYNGVADERVHILPRGE